MRAVLRWMLLSFGLLACSVSRTVYFDGREIGTVRGVDADEVQSTAARLWYADWFARHVVQPLRPEEPDIRLIDARDLPDLDGQVAAEMRDGKIVRRYIELSRSAALPRHTLAHELTHWYLDGVWIRLPDVLEEALCDWVANSSDLRSAEACSRLFREAADVLTPSKLVHALDTTLERIMEGPHDERMEWYSTAFRLAERLQPAQLRAWCERAEREGFEKIPAEWVIEAVCGQAAEAE